MKLHIREDGSGSELDMHDVELVVAINDLPCTGYPVRKLKISGYVSGSIFRPLRFQNQLHSLEEWEAIAYAAWCNEALRRNMYGDTMPDVGQSWTATKGGAPVVWPNWMHESWLSDVRHVTSVTNGNT